MTTRKDINSKFDLTDITQAVIWDKSDYNIVIKHFARTREAQQRKDRKLLMDLIDSVDITIDRFKNDQTLSDPIPIEVIEKKDLVVAAGRTRCAELITGYSSETFDNMAVGTSQITPQDSDWKLYEEVGRVSSQQTGFVSPSGSVMKHVATFSPSFPSGIYWEIAPVDFAVENDEQSILARVVFSADKPAVHTSTEDFFTVHHSTFTSSSA